MESECPRPSHTHCLTTRSLRLPRRFLSMSTHSISSPHSPISHSAFLETQSDRWPKHGRKFACLSEIREHSFKEWYGGRKSTEPKCKQKSPLRCPRPQRQMTHSIPPPLSLARAGYHAMPLCYVNFAQQPRKIVILGAILPFSNRHLESSNHSRDYQKYH
jgi:hypothetical protein